MRTKLIVSFCYDTLLSFVWSILTFHVYSITKETGVKIAYDMQVYICKYTFKRRMQMEGQSEDKVKEHVNSDYWNNTVTLWV